MIPKNCWHVTLLLLIALFGCARAQVKLREDPSYSVEANKIREIVDESLKKANFPAIGILVRANSRTVYFRALGKRSIQHETKANIQDNWHLGSNTKTMTAFLVALAIQEGRLTYHTKLKDILGNEITFHPLNTDITILNLLTHENSLRDTQEVQNGELWEQLFKSKKPVGDLRVQFTRAALEEAPKNEVKASKVPSFYRYTNTNYIILGTVLEKLYGVDWETLAKRRVFIPLKMDSCGFGVAGSSDELEPSQPWAHTLENMKLISLHPRLKADNPPWIGPAGTVHCSLEDWQKFITELELVWNHKGTLLKDPAIASTYFDCTHTPQGGAIVDNSYTYGGWIRNNQKYGIPVLQHSGSNTLNDAIGLFAPDRGISILLVTNTFTAEADRTLGELKKSILKLALEMHK